MSELRLTDYNNTLVIEGDETLDGVASRDMRY